MNHAAIVKEYLKERRGEPIESRGLPFVTISRQAGAGGHTLARDILRALEKRFPADFAEGWEVFDHKLCAMIAQDEKLGISFDALVAEEYRSEISQIIHDLVRQKASRYVVYKRMFEVVRILATLGKCVIVGRGGMCVTGDMPVGVHLRLVAEPETRVKRMMGLLEKGREAAEKTMRDQDRDRKRLVRDFFSRDIEDPQLYDIVVNTDRVTPPEAAELAVDLIAQKMAHFPKRFGKLV